MLARNTILQGRYRIVRPLGRGGMGQVYEALDDTVDAIVVIKETFATSEKLRNAFILEAKRLANLKHPVLPKVMHHFFEGTGQFLVMEFIEGADLARRLNDRGRPFDPEKVLRWSDKLLDALNYLHTQPEPIIHRDIKPANIKVTDDDKVYLLDFGLAKGGPGYETSSVHGYTAAYAPLEQLNNTGTTPQSDLYSLGATLYHLLTGRFPSSASERYKSLEDSEQDSLIPAHEVNPHVPEKLSAIITKAMAMKRKDRFFSASEMREMLRNAATEIKRERDQKIFETPTEPKKDREGRDQPQETIPTPPPPVPWPHPTADPAPVPTPDPKPAPVRRFQVLAAVILVGVIVAVILLFVPLFKPAGENANISSAAQASPAPTQAAVIIQSSPNPAAPAVIAAPTKTDKIANSSPAADSPIPVLYSWQREEPMVRRIIVAAGSHVKKGDHLVEIESEGAQGYAIGGHPLPRQRTTEYFASPISGVVVRINVRESQYISKGDVLLFMRRE